MCPALRHKRASSFLGGIIMTPNHRLPSLLDHFGPSLGDSARDCIERAALCSHLAKLMNGRLRMQLYELKNQNIRTAMTKWSRRIDIKCDRDRHFGLLSIGLRGASAIRVHSHENWIDAA